MTTDQFLTLIGQLLVASPGIAACMYALYQWRNRKTDIQKTDAETERAAAEGVDAVTRAATSLVDVYSKQFGQQQQQIGALQAQRDERDHQIGELKETIASNKRDSDAKIEELTRDNAKLTAQVNILTEQVMALGGIPLGRKPGTGPLGGKG